MEVETGTTIAVGIELAIFVIVLLAIITAAIGNNGTLLVTRLPPSAIVKAFPDGIIPDFRTVAEFEARGANPTEGPGENLNAA